MLDILPKQSNDVLDKPSPSQFQHFLEGWDAIYKAEIGQIQLFNTNLTSFLSEQQKSYFVKAFYHIRGHFHDFLWYMGNHAPDSKTKKIIVTNISEEFGGNYGSHEQLYFHFAESLGVNIHQEIIDETNYDDYIVQFNKGHLNWLRQHDWISCLAAFSAYEHLDNIDYTLLSLLANNIGASKKGMAFFKIHEKVRHFEPLSDLLLEAWNNSPEKIKEGFYFIGQHQLNMWRNLAKRVFNYECKEITT